MLDPAERLDVRLGSGLGEIAGDVVVAGADDGELRGHVLDEALEGLQQDGQALALLGPADEQHSQLLGLGLRSGRRPVQVDPVRDDLVLASEPAPAGPGGRFGNRDPRVKLVELAAGAGEVGDVVRDRLGRVGVEGRDHRRAAIRDRVPADEACGWLVHVHHVGVELGKLAAQGDGARRERRVVGDRAVHPERHAASERAHVAGLLPLLRGSLVEQAREPVGPVQGRQHANLIPA